MSVASLCICVDATLFWPQNASRHLCLPVYCISVQTDSLPLLPVWGIWGPGYATSCLDVILLVNSYLGLNILHIALSEYWATVVLQFRIESYVFLFKVFTYSFVWSSGTIAIEIWSYKIEVLEDLDVSGVCKYCNTLSDECKTHFQSKCKTVKGVIRCHSRYLTRSKWHHGPELSWKTQTLPGHKWFDCPKLCSAAPRASLTAGLLPKKGLCKQQWKLDRWQRSFKSDR